MDPPSYMQNTDSPFQQESPQILCADEMGASSFFTFFVPANTADRGCEQSIKSASILLSFLLCLRTGQVGSTNSQQQQKHMQSSMIKPITNTFHVGNSVKFGLWFIQFSTAVRLALLKTAVPVNSLPTPACQCAPAPMWRG